jgi:hypothetical protein
MHANTALIVLDEQELAAVDGGGPLSWIIEKARDVLVDCLIGNLDTVIDGIKSGYANAS